MTTYFIHYSDGTSQARYWCDECDEREALFFEAHERDEHREFWETTNHEQLCRDCFVKA